MSGRTSDTLIFLLVVGARFLVPLLIPIFPLPAIIACLVIDAADQSVFDLWTNLDLANYQSYDKALDIFYLTIAYLSVMRNWSNWFAVEVARFLWYYRLVGVVLFEVFEKRAILFVFPNTFEYFFIAYEIVRTAWDPRRLSRRAVLAMAGGIWVFIKLPQEWWIHIAQNDFTDFMKETVFGVTAETSWSTAVTNRPVVSILLLVAVTALTIAIRVFIRRLPPRDWPFTVRAEPAVDGPAPMRWPVVEKVVLISLITIIFTNMLGIRMTGTQILVGTIVVVGLNSVLAVLLARRGTDWQSLGVQFAVLALGNTIVITTFVRLVRSGQVNRAAAFFFGLLLTLIIVLYDRFRALAGSGGMSPDRSASGDGTLAQPVVG